MPAWIKLSQDVFTHDKTVQVAIDLDIDEAQVVGHLASLWSSAIDHYPDGKLPECDKRIARAARWPHSASHFVEALTDAGFIDDDYDGHRRLHNWEKWAGALIKRRKNDVERMQKWRKEQARRDRKNGIL